MFADQGRVIAGAASGEDEALGPAKLAGVQVQAAEVGGGVLVRKPAAHGVFQGFGLFVDLLEHVMLEVPLLGVTRVPVDAVDGGVDAGVIVVEDVPTVAVQDTHLAVVQVDDFLRVGEQGAGVAGEEMFVMADADDEGAAEAGADKQIGMARADGGDTVGAFEQVEDGADGFDKVALVVFSMRWAITSVSVSLRKTTPSACNCLFKAA